MMAIDTDTALGGIFTLTSLHMGAGQAAGAVDLPVAREQHTGLPIIPATALKGIWRDIFEIAAVRAQVDRDLVEKLFGPSMDNKPGEEVAGAAGGLIFTEGQSLALPFRSTAGPVLYCTCRLVLERLDRTSRAFGCEFLPAVGRNLENLRGDMVYMANRELDNTMLLVEDLLFQQNEVTFDDSAVQIGKELATLLPEAETFSRNRLAENIVILPDKEFLHLAGQGMPIQARIKLTSGKTASKFQGEEGNLWYEEHVPPDSLFVYFVKSRPGSRNKPAAGFTSAVAEFGDDVRSIQIGGNETVGYGWCWSTLLQSSKTYHSDIQVSVQR